MPKEINKSKIILPTSFLGSVWSYALYFNGQVYIEAFENYQKRSTRNKCHIKTAQGMKSISIPLKSGKNQQQAIQEVKISYEDLWIKEFIHGIRTNYSGAPYLQYYLPDILAIIDKKHEHLWDLNWELNLLILHFLGIDQVPLETENWCPAYSDNTIDHRNSKFQKQEDYVYPQLFEEKGIAFIGNLSILDLMFCCGPEARIHLMNMAENI